MFDFKISASSGLRYHFNALGQLICSGLGLTAPTPYQAPAPAAPEVPPWFGLTQLTTQGGPEYDISTDEGDLPQLETDGLILQDVRGLVVPGGLAGTSPDGLWKLGNMSLADYNKANHAPTIPMDLRVSMLVHKPSHTAAIAGKRMIGWFKQDMTAYLAVGLDGAVWKAEYLVNGTVYRAEISGANATPRYLCASLRPAGTNGARVRIDGYNLPGNAFNLGDPFDINSGVAGADAVGGLFPTNADLKAAIGDGSDWFPCMWIDGYDLNDDPLAFAYVKF